MDIGYDGSAPFEIYVDSENCHIPVVTPHESYVKEPENVSASPDVRAKSL